MDVNSQSGERVSPKVQRLGYAGDFPARSILRSLQVRQVSASSELQLDSTAHSCKHLSPSRPWRKVTTVPVKRCPPLSREVQEQAVWIKSKVLPHRLKTKSSQPWPRPRNAPVNKRPPLSKALLERAVWKKG
ncbi:hypothetical protein MTO96_040460 [Rhipicephalus appendiculatus]